MYAYVGTHLHDALGLSVRASALVALAYGTGFGLAAFGDDTVAGFAPVAWTAAAVVATTAVPGVALMRRGWKL